MGLKCMDNNDTLEFYGQKCPYGNFLLNFIYKDYSKPLSYIQAKFRIFLAEENTDFSIKNIIPFFKNITTANPFLTDDTFDGMENSFKKDAFFILLLYELFTLQSSLTTFDINEVSETIKEILISFKNLQKFYYEAVNICFNKSHEELKCFPINTRINYYSNLPTGINAITHLPNNSIFSTQFVASNKVKHLNDNLFSLDDTDKDFSLYPTSTDVSSRLDKVTYNSSHKQLYHACPKNYNLYMSDFDFKKNVDFIKVVDFNNVLALCSFCFFKLIEYRDKISIQECKLCGKLFAKSAKSKKEYCDNIFPTRNLPCSNPNVGAKIMFNIKEKENELYNFYLKIYKKLCNRRYLKDKNLLRDLDYIRNLWKSGNISSSQFESALNYLNTIKPNTYDRNDIEKSRKDIFNLLTIRN